jgi:hypothetical protein
MRLLYRLSLLVLASEERMPLFMHFRKAHVRRSQPDLLFGFNVLLSLPEAGIV